MATSTIKLFVGCKIVPEKNFKVDSIWDYLNTILDTTIADFMYVKNKKNITLKIDLPQTKLKVDSANNINYIAVTNSDETSRAYFYFVKERNWKSSNTIEYVCEMDTINTFAYGSDYTLTDKTTIQRQHKDRFKSEFVYANKLSGGVTDWGVRSVGGITSAKFVVNDSHLIGLAQSDIYFNCSIDYLPGQTEGTMSIDYDDLTSDGIITINIAGLDALPAFNYVINYHTNAKNLIRIIDEESEGFNVPLWGKDEEVLTQEIQIFNPNTSKFETRNMGENTWYLTYKTNTAYDNSHPDDFIYDNAINCFLTTDAEDFKVNTNGWGIKITKTDYQNALTANPNHNSDKMYIGFSTGAEGKKLYNSFAFDYPDIKEPMWLGVYLMDANDDIIDVGKVECSWVSNSNHKRMKQTCLCVYQSGGNVKVSCIKLKRDNVTEMNGTLPQTTKDWSLENGNYIVILGVSAVSGYFTTRPLNVWDFNWYQAFVNANAGSSSFTDSTGHTRVQGILKSFKNVNRTEQKLVKIINIPYCPINIENSNELVWNNSEEQLTLNVDSDTKVGTYDPKFSRSLNLIPSNESGDTYLLSDNIKLSNITPSLTDIKNINKESKLLHSDFYYISCNYDSFSYAFRNELLDTDELQSSILNYVSVDYAVSNSMASAFALNFGKSFPLKKQYQAYNVMCVNRNLEIPIYNNYYMNYLRNGYNYDVKNKNTQAIGTGIGVGLGVASTVAGIALSATGYGSTFGAPMIVAGVSSIAGSTANAVIKSTQADRNIQQKLDEAKNQGASVSGSDDIGLLKWYANNNLCKLMKWECSDNTKERLFDLFYYCGYICNYQAVPNMTSRAWFNFVQCEPQFGICYVPNDLKEDISNKFKAGITVLHKQNGTWDFDQAKENWENTLLN